MDRDFDRPDDSRPRRHRTANLAGPMGLFGRGRAISLIIMGIVCLFAYLNHTDDESLATTRTATLSTESQYLAPEVPANLRSTVARYGGVVEDSRTRVLRQVGDELASSVSHIQPGTIRFYLVGDNKNAFSVATTDGAVLMSVAQFARYRSADQLATDLSQRIAEFVYKGYDPKKFPEVGQYRDQLIAATGYRQIIEGESQSMIARSSGDSTIR